MLRCPVAELMLRSRENHPSGCIFHRYLLLLLIDLNFHIGIFHRGVADVDPLRELLFDFALLILDANGITGDRSKR